MVSHRDSSLTLPGVSWFKEKPGVAAGSSKPQSGTRPSRERVGAGGSRGH